MIINPTVFAVFLAVVAVAAVVGATVIAVSLTATRRERLTRHESIPQYYGRLHFAR